MTTPRIFEENGVYNMIYAGSNDSVDEPRDFGLATSSDLLHWTKFSGNPIFGVGPKGAWDGGCIWFGTTEKIGGKRFLWYEGSRGNYTTGVASQVGMAILGKESRWYCEVQVVGSTGFTQPYFQSGVRAPCR